MFFTRSLCCLAALFLVGCQGLNVPSFSAPQWRWPSLGLPSLNLRSQSPDTNAEDLDDEFRDTVRTRFVGDYTTFTGRNLIVVRGVGLVTGLDGTGGDPAASPQREALLDDMRRHNVPLPNRILSDPTTALVIVEARLPPLIRKGERFDVNVVLPDSSNATSLAGGVLLATHLIEQAIIPGEGVKKGHELAIAKGPILALGSSDESPSRAGSLRRGRVLSGGISRIDRDLAIYLRNDSRAIRMARRIATRVGERFYLYNRYGTREPAAEAKNDQRIVLKVQRRYRDNYDRYLQAVRNIAFREDEVARRVRMVKLKEQLRDPQTSEIAAIRLEAIGKPAIPILKTGLKSEILEVRFHSALALAYLEDGSGLKVLAEAARNERAFRVFALAAMATLDEAETHVLLRDLMNEKSNETRYGAFRALWTLDKHDPFIRGENMDGKFRLHVLSTTAGAGTSVEPLIHITHHDYAEIVLFGINQQLKTPLALKAGNHIRVNARPGSETVVVSRYQLGTPDLREEVPARIEDVIRKVVEFGANYPDVADMLVAAQQQGNTVASVEIDTLPQAGRIYQRPSVHDDDAPAQATIGRRNQGPNLYPATSSENDNEDATPLTLSDEPTRTGNATLADATDRRSDRDDQNQDEIDEKTGGRFDRVRRLFRFPGRNVQTEPPNPE